MNLPNKLTMLRIMLVPLFVAAMLIPFPLFPLHNLAALLIFAIASITDMFDGRIARERNLVTDFGKFADPLADKILVLAAMLCFVQNGLCDCVAVIIVLLREFAVTSIRLIAAAKGEVVAANKWGKVKTVTQMVAIITILVMQTLCDILNEFAGIDVSIAPHSIISEIFFCVGELLIWISTIFAIISGVIYLKQNWKFIEEI